MIKYALCVTLLFASSWFFVFRIENLLWAKPAARNFIKSRVASIARSSKFRSNRADRRLLALFLVFDFGLRPSVCSAVSAATSRGPMRAAAHRVCLNSYTPRSEQTWFFNSALLHFDSLSRNFLSNELFEKKFFAREFQEFMRRKSILKCKNLEWNTCERER